MKIIKGFIFTPIILSFLIAVSISLSVFFFESEHSKFTLFLVGLAGWFLHALPVTFLFITCVGVPGYLAMRKLSLFKLKDYLAAGFIIGAILPLPMLFFYPAIKWWLCPMSGLMGFVSSCIFWSLAIKP